MSDQTDVKPGEAENEVGCALQYWDACLGGFRNYSEFHLSEHQVCHLDLPLTTDRKKMAMSSVWRVLLNVQDDEVDADFHKLDREIIVQPKSLVSGLPTTPNLILFC